MKIFKKAILPLFICVGLSVAAYQNCSNLNTVSISALNETSPPILFISLSDYSRLNQCPDQTDIEESVLINEKEHLCFVTSSSCEKNSALQLGFSEEGGENCEAAKALDSDDLIESFSYWSAKDLGYKSDPQTMCSMQFQTMIHVKSRKCSDGANGCEIQFLKEQGFSSDTLRICNEVDRRLNE